MAFRYIDGFLDRFVVETSECGIYEGLLPAGKYEQPSMQVLDHKERDLRRYELW
jgi:hypothetical protein